MKLLRHIVRSLINHLGSFPDVGWQIAVVLCLLCDGAVSQSNVHDAAIQNISSVLFDSKSKPVRDRHKAFENAYGVKLNFRVEDASLDQLGGLSEHLFRLFQNFTSPSNVNAATITGEFSCLTGNQLSSQLSYSTRATADLRTCALPLKDTGRLDSLYNKALGHLPGWQPPNIQEAPENLDGVYTDAAVAYGNIIYKNNACPAAFSNSAYNQHVVNTRSTRAAKWTADINALSLAISGNYMLLTSENFPAPAGPDLGIPPTLPQAKHALILNNAVNACTQEDMEVRCRILYRKTNIRFLFVTQTIDYFIPADSLTAFCDAATVTFTGNTTDDVIIGLYLKLNDATTGKHGNTLLVKQVNGSWLTQADINFANFNNSSSYTASAFHKFNNLYKNIPKPLVICAQVAKVNGLLTTVYITKGDHVKGREQIYYHSFRIDRAFDELKQLDNQLRSLAQQYSGGGSPLMGTANGSPVLLKQIDHVLNQMKRVYANAAKTPNLREADRHIKEVYLQKLPVAQAGALKIIQEEYGLLYYNNQFTQLIGNAGLPGDLYTGTCKSSDNSDVIADILMVTSLLLAPTGIDFIPDALSVAWFASQGNTLEFLQSSASLVLPGNVRAIKKATSGVKSVFEEVHLGNVLTWENGAAKAIQQDNNLMAAVFSINLDQADQAFIDKINANPGALHSLIFVPEQKGTLYSNVSRHLDEPKRREFVTKAINEPGWRQKVIDDPDEVLRWAGKYETQFSKAACAQINGFSDNISAMAAGQGITVNEFKSLAAKSATALSAGERAKIDNIRNQVPTPDVNTVMQKIIPKSDIPKYLSGQYTSCRGFMTTAADAKHLNTFEDMYYGLRLDYVGSPFQPNEGGNGVIRFKPNKVNNLTVPRDLPSPDPFPFANHGFTSAINDRISVPEFYSAGFVEMKDGAELWILNSNGTETLQAVYNLAQNKFIQIGL